MPSKTGKILPGLKPVSQYAECCIASTDVSKSCFVRARIIVVSLLQHVTRSRNESTFMLAACWCNLQNSSKLRKTACNLQCNIDSPTSSKKYVVSLFIWSDYSASVTLPTETYFWHTQNTSSMYATINTILVSIWKWNCMIRKNAWTPGCAWANFHCLLCLAVMEKTFFSVIRWNPRS